MDFSWMNSKINIEYAILILVKGQRFSETLELLDLCVDGGHPAVLLL